MDLKNHISEEKCLYFQARVDKKRAWFVMGVFRNEDNVAFVRALDGSSEVFEFFVPSGLTEPFFIAIKYLESNGHINNFQQLENRLV